MDKNLYLHYLADILIIDLLLYNWYFAFFIFKFLIYYLYFIYFSFI